MLGVHAFHEIFVDGIAVVLQTSRHNMHTSIFQSFDALTSDERIGINNADDNLMQGWALRQRHWIQTLETRASSSA